ncbi:alkaline phosphatase family protein [Fusibacter sp. JL216-2]|uniref:alkaline phosphatase family protein n=1 Tax=Fusibacter sp. JL216-2 TaxID=3071453 RepID=UPI003D33A89D
MKTITLLLDGVGDRSYDLLGGKTPLEYAKTPNLDKIAQTSQCGLMTPLQVGASLGTDLAHFILFGYKTHEYPNRAVIDAIGENVSLNKDDLILRASFADVSHDGQGYLLNSRFTKDLSAKEINDLIQAVDCQFDGWQFKCIHSYDSHGFVIVSRTDGKEISSEVSDSDPFYAPQYVMKIEPFETVDPISEETANAINRFLKRTHDILQGHEVNKNRAFKGEQAANFILTKWAGRYTGVEPFQIRTGMRGQLLGQSKLLNGLSHYVGLDFQSYETFDEAVHLALSSEYEYVHLHTKAPDEASHKKSPMKKVEALEEIDKSIETLLDFEGLLIVTADHSTPCAGEMIHSGESVPFMARGEYVRQDRVDAFNEVACANGSVMLTGADFIHYIHSASDRGNLYHLRVGNKWRNYRPTKVNKL